MCSIIQHYSRTVHILILGTILQESEQLASAQEAIVEANAAEPGRLADANGHAAAPELLERAQAIPASSASQEADKLEDDAAEQERRDLVDLLQHGAELVVADEGHRMKNEKAYLSQCMELIKTHRRIILTGYPLQNYLKEYALTGFPSSWLAAPCCSLYLGGSRC